MLASRTVFVAADRKESLRLAVAGLRRNGAKLAGMNPVSAIASVEETITALDIHTGGRHRTLTLKP
ncbi:MAG: hypothetical protein GEV05_19430 [Betaproteobacteria bacterium]|nr:hypothetical protein [Betaproteobacteria bacterium]